MTVKLCGNCMHREIRYADEQCWSCALQQQLADGDFPNWEPMTPAQIDALYSRAEEAEIKARRWRRKAKRLKKRIAKQDDQTNSMADFPGYGLCMYCKFGEQTKHKEPCNRCRWLGLGSNDEWRPKTAARETIDRLRDAITKLHISADASRILLKLHGEELDRDDLVEQHESLIADILDAIKELQAPPEEPA